MNLLKRFRPSPAMVIACLALLLALGGTGYAAIKLPRNSVTTVQVKDFSLLARDFKRGQIPAGPVGPTGPARPPTTRAASAWRPAATPESPRITRSTSRSSASGGISPVWGNLPVPPDPFHWSASRTGG